MPFISCERSDVKIKKKKKSIIHKQKKRASTLRYNNLSFLKEFRRLKYFSLVVCVDYC